MAVAERSGAVGEALKATKTVDFERESKLDELQKEMERLQQEIEGLQREFQQPLPLLGEKTGSEIKSGDEEEPICFSCMEYKKGSALFPCGHTFCWKCTSKLRRGQGPCPHCFKRFWTAVPSSLL